MDAFLSPQLCQIVISYLTDFRDIRNLIKLLDNSNYDNLSELKLTAMIDYSKTKLNSFGRTIGISNYISIEPLGYRYTTYIQDADIYALFTPLNENDFDKFPKAHNISFHQNNTFFNTEFIKKRTLSYIHSLNLGNDSQIIDDDLQYLQGIRSLNVGCNSKITNKGIVQLQNICVLYLQWDSKISSSGIRCLPSINTLYLNSCRSMIEDLKSITLLKNLHTVDFGPDSSIIDHMLDYFRNIRKLYFGWKSRITNEGLVNLKNKREDSSYNKRLKLLHLGDQSKITDDGLVHLKDIFTDDEKNINTLHLGAHSQITNDGLIHLHCINVLYLGYNSKITNDGLVNLIHHRLYELYLGSRSQITNDGLIHLKSVKNLHLGDNSLITDDGLSYLMDSSICELHLGNETKITEKGIKKISDKINVVL